MRTLLLLLLLACCAALCAAQPTTPAPDTPLPDSEDPEEPEEEAKSSPLKWLPLAVAFGLTAGMTIVAGVMAWKSGRPGVSVKHSLTLMLPPLSVAELKRAFTTDMRPLSPTRSEAEALETARVSTPFASSLLCWRRTSLSLSIIFYFASAIITLVGLADDGTLGVSVKRSAPFSDDIALRARMKERMLALIPLCQSLIAVLFYSIALYRWHDLARSRSLVVCGWAFVFLMPFAYFSLPWLDIDSPQNYVTDMCKFLVQALNGAVQGSDVQILFDSAPMEVSVMCAGDSTQISNRFTEGLVTVIGGGTFGTLAMTFIGLVLRYVIYVPFLIASFEVMKALAPGVLGVLTGLQSGVLICKTMFPGARLTSWLLIILQACTIPVVMFLCAVILVVVGTVPVMVTALALTASMGLYIAFPKKLLQAVTPEETEAVMKKFSRISLVLKLIGLAALIVGVLIAPHLVALKDEGVDVVTKALKPLTILKMAISFLAGMFGSKIVFVDIVVYIVMSTYIGCFEDAQEAREATMRSLLNLCCTFDDYEGQCETYLPGHTSLTLVDALPPGQSVCNTEGGINASPLLAKMQPLPLQTNPVQVSPAASQGPSSPEGHNMSELSGGGRPNFSVV